MSVDDRKTLARLEREILALRRSLTPDREPLPRQPFDALVVVVGGGAYAIPVDSVREVLQMLWCDPVPDAPPWVLGTFRLGSAVVPAVHLRARLEGQPARLTSSMALVVVEVPRAVGFAVQEVRGLVRVDPAAVAPPDEGIPQAPFLLGTVPTAEGASLRLLSSRRLARESALEDETERDGQSD